MSYTQSVLPILNVPSIEASKLGGSGKNPATDNLDAIQDEKVDSRIASATDRAFLRSVPDARDVTASQSGPSADNRLLETNESGEHWYTLGEASRLISSLRSQGDINFEAKVVDIVARIQCKEQHKSAWEKEQLDAYNRAAKTMQHKSAWEEAQDDAYNRVAKIIGNVMLANSRFHHLELIPDENFMSRYYNHRIEEHNMRAEEFSREGVMNMANALEHAGVGNVVTQTETGEYKLKGFKIHSERGELVSELLTDGRYIEYNQDGSIFRQTSRAQTSAMPQFVDSIYWAAGYGAYALENGDASGDTEFF